MTFTIPSQNERHVWCVKWAVGSHRGIVRVLAQIRGKTIAFTNPFSHKSDFAGEDDWDDTVDGAFKKAMAKRRGEIFHLTALLARAHNREHDLQRWLKHTRGAEESKEANHLLPSDMLKTEMARLMKIEDRARVLIEGPYGVIPIVDDDGRPIVHPDLADGVYNELADALIIEGKKPLTTWP